MGDEDFAHDQSFLWSGELETKPDPEARKEKCYETTVNLKGVLHHEESILDQPQRQDDCAGDDAIDKNGPLHGADHIEGAARWGASLCNCEHLQLGADASLTFRKEGYRLQWRRERGRHRFAGKRTRHRCRWQEASSPEPGLFSPRIR